VKIKIERPDAEAAKDIFSKYVTPELPLHADDLAEHSGDREATVGAMIQATVERMYSEIDENRFLEVTYANGDKEVMYFRDFNSGAMIQNIVDRAKKTAIKDFLDHKQKGLRVSHLLGWYGHGTAFDVLPVVIEAPGYRPYVHVLPQDCVLEVPLSHPRHPWFAELGIRWHAVPAISDMCLEIGGLHYPCAPFNGWYMGTEIGSRNLADADRYDLLPTVAANLGLDTTTDRTLWRDRALVELNVAVLHSYEAAGVTIADHHTEAHRFLKHVAKEERAGRVCPAEWSWIVPPLSGSATAVFHRYYDEADARPNFVRHEV